MLPLSIPALGAFAIFQFLWVWNDLLVALVFLGPGADVRVMPTALFNLLGAYGGAWHLLTAGAFLTMIVPLVVFLVLQRAFVEGSWPAPSSDPGTAHDRRLPRTRSRAHVMGLRDEILEQPAAVQRLLDSAPAAFAPIAAAVRARRPRFAVIAARGTSDNAGIYAQYLLAIRNGLIVALAAPSTITLYGARPNMADALVVGISQSGRSPDIVAVVEEARRQGALTVALTNDTDSPLAETADHVVDLRAGPGAGDGRDQDLHDRAARGGAAVDGARPAIGRGNGRPGRPARPDVGRADGGAACARPGRRARRSASVPSCSAAATATRALASGRSSCRSWRSSRPCRIRRPTSSTGRWPWPSPACRCWRWPRAAPSSRPRSPC